MNAKRPSRRGFNYVPFAMIPTCAVHDSRVTPGMLQVLVCCGSYATQKSRHWLWGTQADVAHDLGITRQAVGQHLERLESFGYVELRRGNYREDGGKATNGIRLLMDVIVPDQYLRDNLPRRREGIGGRPKIRVIHTVDKAPPVNSEFTPPKLNGVSYPETPEVSYPRNSMEFHTHETPKQHSGDTNPHEFRADGTRKRRKEDPENGSIPIERPGRAAPVGAAHDVVHPSRQKISRAEAERRHEEAKRREDERLYGKAAGQ